MDTYFDQSCLNYLLSNASWQHLSNRTDTEHTAPGLDIEMVMSSLNCLHPKATSAALDLIDRDLVAALVAENGAIIYQIIGKQNKPDSRYRLLDVRQPFCVCDTFQQKVLKGKQSSCEHILAISFAKATGKLRRRSISNDEWSEIMRVLLHS